MQERIFSYTAQRASALSTLFALLFIMAGESILIVILIAIFLHVFILKLVLIGLLLALELFIALNLLSPLWTKHRLNATTLRLYFGMGFRAYIPRSAIVSIKPVRERAVIAAPRYEKDKQRIIAAMSEHGQVLLHLDQPYPFRVGLSRVQADSILFNVDDRDALIIALEEIREDQTRTTRAIRNTRATARVAPTINRYGRGDPRGRPGVANRPGGSGRPGVVNRPGGSGRPGVANRPGGSGRPGSLVSQQDESIALRTEHLTRHYHDILAVDDLNLAIQQGEIYGFLGTNGAGKTTTMKMLVGLLQPTGGWAWINGFDVWSQPLQAKASLGFVADRSLLYDRLTGHEFLSFLAQLRGIPREEAEKRIEELLNMLELRERANSLCGTYSFGMKRKLSLAGALLHRPAVLILDEPLNGLDPLSARRLKDLFGELASQGTTIFLSTHDLATAEAICHRVGIIAQGRLLAEGSASELRQLAEAPDLEAVFLSLTAEETVV